MQNRKASIKETGEELSAAEWERFDLAVADLKRERRRREAEGRTGEQDKLAEAEPQAVA